MRKAFFAVVLVAAAFAGGAAVNGPGLKWARGMILHRGGMGMGTGSGSEAENANPDDPTRPLVTEDAGAGVPSAPVAPLVVEPAKSDPVPTSARIKEKEKGPAKPQEAPAPNPNPNPEPAAKSPEPRPADTKPAPGASADMGLPTPRVESLPPLEAAEPAPEEKAKDEGAKEKPFGDLPDSAPAAAVAPRAENETNPIPTPGRAESDPALARAALTTTEAPAAGPNDWAQLRAKMRDLGVSRYGFDGEPSGRVRFHCLIPLAGKRAVGQHFEADGDDEFQAARAALRRVALWRATEAPKP